MNDSPKLDLSFLEASADSASIRNSLALLWSSVREQLEPLDDDALGEIHVGQADAGRNETPWAHTNHGEERPNLTIELQSDELELNLVGWKETQSDALKDWLQSVEGEKSVAQLAGYEVVAFERRAYKKTPQSRPWWQDETVVELGRIDAARCDTRWVTQQVLSLGSRTEVKPAFHIRRTWRRTDAIEMGDRLPKAIAGEVKQLVPILRSIWNRSASK